MAELFVKRTQCPAFSSDQVKLTDLLGRHFAEIAYYRWVRGTGISLDPSRRKKIEIKEVE